MTRIDPLELVEAHRDDVPVPVFEILEKLGLGPTFQSLAENVSGWIQRSADGDYDVVVNADHHLVRQRFTAAHELGHYIYHRELLGAGVGDDRAYRQEGTPIAANASIRPMHERQANSFAANLLMPVRSINALRAQGVVTVDDLAARLQVSKDAMRIRLGIPRV